MDFRQLALFLPTAPPRASTSPSSRTIHAFMHFIFFITYPSTSRMSFCQVMLKRNLINDVRKNPYHLDWWATKVKEHTDRYPEDPIPIPFRDPEPQVTTPLTEEHPWHTQVRGQ